MTTALGNHLVVCWCTAKLHRVELNAPPDTIGHFGEMVLTSEFKTDEAVIRNCTDPYNMGDGGQQIRNLRERERERVGEDGTRKRRRGGRGERRGRSNTPIPAITSVC